jgi:hypothetical protein
VTLSNINKKKDSGKVDLLSAIVAGLADHKASMLLVMQALIKYAVYELRQGSGMDYKNDLTSVLDLLESKIKNAWQVGNGHVISAQIHHVHDYATLLIDILQYKTSFRALIRKVLGFLALGYYNILDVHDRYFSPERMKMADELMEHVFKNTEGHKLGPYILNFGKEQDPLRELCTKWSKDKGYAMK